jgi:dUTP pyrophosphatase
MAVCWKINKSSEQLKAGDRHFQLVLHKICGTDDEVDIVDSLENSQRGQGGFGSTGKN